MQLDFTMISLPANLWYGPITTTAKKYLRSDDHARIYWCDLQHHNQHKDWSRECQKGNIAITLQLITTRSVTSIFTLSCEQLIFDLACVCRLWCGGRWCFSWPWSNHLEDQDQEKNRPWPRNNIHALFEIVKIEYQELFQQLLTAVPNSKEIQVFHYEICRYPPVLFDSPPSCLSLKHLYWLDTCKYSCFR